MKCQIQQFKYMSTKNEMSNTEVQIHVYKKWNVKYSSSNTCLQNTWFSSRKISTQLNESICHIKDTPKLDLFVYVQDITYDWQTHTEHILLLNIRKLGTKNKTEIVSTFTFGLGITTRLRLLANTCICFVARELLVN